MDMKKISIVGQTNRYQIKKLTHYEKLVEKKEIMEEKYYDRDFQMKLLYENDPKLLKNIETKLYGYRHQDELKKRIFDNNITLDEIICKMKQSFACHYCKQLLLLFYKYQREKTQWTLDRISNNLPHQKDNIVLSCLQCNLERRTKSQEKFIFTKNLIIQKI